MNNFRKAFISKFLTSLSRCPCPQSRDIESRRTGLLTALVLGLGLGLGGLDLGLGLDNTNVIPTMYG